MSSIREFSVYYKRVEIIQANIIASNPNARTPMLASDFLERFATFIS